MVELIRNYIGKECVIYTMNSQITGVIKEVANGGVVVDRPDGVELFNIDYIIRVREYPRKKNGKRRAFVMD